MENKELFFAHGPFLTNADIGKLTISFISSTPCGSSLEYRKKGEKEWKKIYLSAGGQVIGKTCKHIYHLKDLVPGGEYEYKAGLFFLFAEEKKVEKSSFFTVFSPDKKEYSFFVMADLQYPLEKRDLLMEKYFSLCQGEKCDFIVSLGDMIWAINDFEKEALSGMIDAFCKLGADHIPLVLVRGNHEMLGKESFFWNEYFGSREGKSYYGFRQGNCAFLALDSWAGQKGGGENPDFHYNLDKEFLEEEKTFIESAVKEESFLTAPFRIVMAHGATHGHIDQFAFLNPNLRYLTDQYFRGKEPLIPIHLWICGHIHHYIRTIPFKPECASISRPPQPIETPEEYSFPSVTTDGPDVAKELVPPSGIHSSIFWVRVTEEYLEVKALAEEREGEELIDHFKIYKDRRVEELLPITHYKWESCKNRTFTGK